MFSLDRSPRLATTRRVAFALAATAAVAAGAPAAAQASSCFADLDGPGSGAWQVTADGTLDGAVYHDFPGGGSTFDEGFGLLHVNGAVYPAAPNDGCAVSGENVSYPARAVGGVTVSRTVSSVDGALRYVDTITNPTNQFKHVTADFELAVLGSQAPVMSESGNATVNGSDHWAVLKSDGTFPFVRWGTDDALSEPEVDPADPQLQAWQPNFGTTDNATLRYEQIQLGAGQTVRLLHWSGATGAQASATGEAQNAAKPFTGMSKAFAKQVVNWGPDVDGDGVPVFSDDCPAVKGNGADGCALGLAPQPDPADPDPADPKPADPQPQPQPVPDPAPVPQPAPQPAPGIQGADQRGVPAPRDARAPRVTLSGLKARTSPVLLRGRGLRPRLTCDEACSLTVKVTARKRVRGKAKTVTLRTVRLSGRTVDPRTVALKLSAKQLRGALGRKLTVAMVATDGSGNATRVVRGVKVSR